MLHIIHAFCLLMCQCAGANAFRAGLLPGIMFDHAAAAITAHGSNSTDAGAHGRRASDAGSSQSSDAAAHTDSDASSGDDSDSDASSASGSDASDTDVSSISNSF